MTLLDNGPHTVTVQRMKDGAPDRYGKPVKVPDGEPIEVRGCLVSAVSVEELSQLGVVIQLMYRVRHRTWPGGPYSKVTWEGQTLWQRGGTRRSRIGRATRSQSAYLVTHYSEVA